MCSCGQFALEKLTTFMGLCRASFLELLATFSIICLFLCGPFFIIRFSTFFFFYHTVLHNVRRGGAVSVVSLVYFRKQQCNSVLDTTTNV